MAKINFGIEIHEEGYWDSYLYCTLMMDKEHTGIKIIIYNRCYVLEFAYCSSLRVT